MWKSVALIILLAAPVAFAKVLDQKDCEQLLSSYENQRAGADPKLVESVRTHGRKIREQLLGSELGRNLTELVHDLKPTDSIRKVLSLSDDRELVVRQIEYDGSWEIVERKKDGTTSAGKILLRSKDLLSVAELSFDNLKVSPDKEHFAVQYREYGSIDESWISIYSMEEGAVVTTLAATYDFEWVSPHRLMFEALRVNDETEHGVRVYDLLYEKKLVWSRVGSVSSSFQDWALSYKGSLMVLHHEGNEYELPSDFPYGYLFGADETYLYFKTMNGTWSNNKIVRLEIKSLESAKLKFQDLIPENAYRLADVAFKDGYILLERTFGEHHDVAIYNVDGSFVAAAGIPTGATVTNWSWETKGEVLRLKLSNPVRPSYISLFDLKSKSFLDNIDKALLTDQDGRIYDSCVIYATSADGIKVPVRLFYKKMGRSNPCTPSRSAKKRPVLIESYGGFFLGGSFIDSYDPMAKEFLDRGGILVHPALRGGNEFGGSWHYSGQLLAKPNTLNDLIATAEDLVRRGITSPNLISSMGTSNGGFVVAAATSQRPDLFGLTIPINGVLDWEKSQELDPTFNGWKHEYGDTSKEEISSLRKKLSPTSLAPTTNYQNLLVVTGLNDSRVNPAHSYNFVEAAENGPTRKENIHWLAVKNTGHWAASLGRQGHTAKHVQRVIWTAIFRQSGFKN